MDPITLNSHSSKGAVPRRRAAQACSTCRGRKVRCDAGLPRCGLCVDLDVDCVYLDPQNSKIDPSTRILLERIQRLEDRLFSSPILQPTPPLTAASIAPGYPVSSPASNERKGQLPAITSPTWRASLLASEADNNFLSLPAMHDANANHVYRAPIIQDLIDRGLSNLEYPDEVSAALPKLHDATDIFLLEIPENQNPRLPIESWRLFDDGSDRDFIPKQPYPGLVVYEMGPPISKYEEVIGQFFIDISAFYSIIHRESILQYFRTVFLTEVGQQIGVQSPVNTSQYCLLLLVLCLGSLTMSGNIVLPAFPLDPNNPRGPVQDVEDHTMSNHVQSGLSAEFEIKMWQKVQLLLGYISTEDSIEAAQCFALISIYLGAKGKAVDAHCNIHMAARKCKIIAKRVTLQENESVEFSDAFKRLFWVVYVIESDFISELSIIPPSGITIFEDVVPYPSSSHAYIQTGPNMGMDNPPSTATESNSRCQDDFSAYQIITNSAIQRFINRVTAVMYNPTEAWRKENPTTYATWLQKMADELRSHHEAIYQNLPPFLLTTDPIEFRQHLRLDQNALKKGADDRRFQNHLWNVARLRSRYFAGLYIIHRPLFEYVLLNSEQLKRHPAKDAIFESCRACILGCSGFVKVMFDAQANCLTSLLATGMVTFTMIIILMIATATPDFQSILPADIESIISKGQQNMRRYSRNVKKFEWHIRELEKIDRGRRSKN